MIVDWEHEGLIAVRDGLRVGLGVMPADCESAVTLTPLLRSLDVAIASFEAPQSA